MRIPKFGHLFENHGLNGFGVLISNEVQAVALQDPLAEEERGLPKFGTFNVVSRSLACVSKAREEAAAGDLKDAVQWSFASLEAAIDALAAKHGIVIEEQHWRRRDAAHELMLKGVLPRDLSDLHQLLNEERKAMFYEGEDPDLGDFSIEDVVNEVETTVKIAEAEAD